MSKIDFSVYAKAAKEAQIAMDYCNKIESIGGAGRVYLVFSEKFRSNSKIAKALESSGFRFMRRAYSSANNAYIGYHNFQGKEWSKAHAAAEVFKNHGIKCYVDADED